MSDELALERDAGAAAGVMVEAHPLVRRLIAPNPGPFTHTGTCTYLVGRGRVAVIDPGPAEREHLLRLVEALKGETVTHIVVTHTHRDHSPAARELKALTGAPIVGCGPHRPARELALGEASRLDASADADHSPDVVMREGDAIGGEGWTLEAIETPGHTANHLAFALPEADALFSGDHVMAWSTTIVAPPDGSMTAYMASLERLRARTESVYWPGHGGPVRDPQRFVRALIGHRRAREASILRRLSEGDRTIGEIVPRIYDGLAPALHGAAALSTFAHLEDLTARGLVRTPEGTPSLTGRYELA